MRKPAPTGTFYLPIKPVNAKGRFPSPEEVTEQLGNNSRNKENSMARLAINGGEKAVTIPNSEARLPIVSEEDIQAAVDLMRKGEISVSPIVEEFEKEFAQYIGTEYGLASNSGTSSLHEALVGVGVSAGDEVIVPSYTFGPGAIVILAAHGVPVFCDVDRETHCIDPEDAARKITPRTRAILLVHVWGNPCDMGSIMQLARKHNIAVVEDCSHAHGAEWHGKKVGAIGDVGGFSLQGSKILKAGEGGVLTTSDRECYERAATYGRGEKIGKFPEDSHYKQCIRIGMGFKHRPHPLGIAIAREQFRHLDERNEVRDGNGAYLDAGIADIEAVKVQKVLPDCRRVYAYHCAAYDSEKLNGVSMKVFLQAIHAEGVRCDPIRYGWLHKASLFTEGSPYNEDCLGQCPLVKTPSEFAAGSLPATEYLCERNFMIAPRFETECRELVDQYIEAYHKVTSSVDELLAFERKQ